jgi:hypothetical protein
VQRSGESSASVSEARHRDTVGGRGAFHGGTVGSAARACARRGARRVGAVESASDSEVCPRWTGRQEQRERQRAAGRATVARWGRAAPTVARRGHSTVERVTVTRWRGRGNTRASASLSTVDKVGESSASVIFRAISTAPTSGSRKDRCRERDLRWRLPPHGPGAPGRRLRSGRSRLLDSRSNRKL